MKILILDAYNANSLAITRYLGRMGYDIFVVGNSKRNIAFYSKYVKGKYVLPDAKKNEEEFKYKLLDLVKSRKFDVMLPVGFKTFELCSGMKTELDAYIKTFLPSAHAVELASNKLNTYKLADQTKVPYPRTIEINSLTELDNTLPINFPVVVKSQIELGKTLVDYASNTGELKQKYLKMVKENNFSSPNLPIIQEYIEGEGYGFFAFYQDGSCSHYFMHHRVREYPPTGGISTCAEAFEDMKLKDYSCRLLDALKWNGVAMVEFKKKSNGEYILMEINPKFWGSLELSMRAGVNFPELVINAATGKSQPPFHGFNFIRFQWLLNGELFHLFERPSSFFKIVKDFFGSKNDFWWRDIKPTLLQFVNIFYHCYKKIKS